MKDKELADVSKVAIFIACTDDPSYQGHSSIPRKDIGSEIDLISDLLRKGQRLRTAMVTSSQGTQLCTKNVPASSHYPHSRLASYHSWVDIASSIWQIKIFVR